MTTKKSLAATVLAFVLAASGSTSGQTSGGLPEIAWEVVPGAIYNTLNNGITLTFGCRTVTHNPTWSPGGVTRNSLVKLHIRLQPPRADGTYATGAGVYSSGTDRNNMVGSQICDLRRGADTVSFSNITLPSTDPQYIERLRLAVRYYRGERYSPHRGLRMNNGAHFFFRANGGFTDNVNDGPTPQALADSEDYDGF